MYKASNPEVVVNLTQLLPPCGENRSALTYDNGILNIDVFFDSQSRENEDSIRLTFEGTVAFIASVAPGADITNFQCKGGGNMIGNVVEFQTSAAATAWMKALPWRTSVRHFSLLLMEEGRIFHVFSADCKISNAQSDS
jgi:hypothetical protein